MNIRVIHKFIPGTAVFLFLLLLSGCDWMESSKKSYESIAVEDIIAKSHLSEAVEYSYVKDGHERQKLDFYRYEAEKGIERPTLVWIHGGAWIEGDKGRIDPLAFEVAGLGKYNLISINYRLADDESAPWPEIVYDVKAALRWIKLNSAKLEIDPRDIILMGESAGAHLAAMAAFSTGAKELEGDKNPGVTTEVKAVVLFYGPYNMSSLAVQKNSAMRSGMCEEPQYSSPILELLDCPETDKKKYNIDSCDLSLVRTADPGAFLDKSDPPAYLVHGEHDCTVPWGQSKALHDELDDVGVRNVFVSVEGGVHSIGSLGIEAQDIVDFIHESLVDEKENVTDADGPKPPTKQ
jgi:acetyl esterase/lipase